jgi:hypothetical protein
MYAYHRPPWWLRLCEILQSTFCRMNVEMMLMLRGEAELDRDSGGLVMLRKRQSDILVCSPPVLSLPISNIVILSSCITYGSAIGPRLLRFALQLRPDSQIAVTSRQPSVA